MHHRYFIVVIHSSVLHYIIENITKSRTNHSAFFSPPIKSSRRTLVRPRIPPHQKKASRSPFSPYQLFTTFFSTRKLFFDSSTTPFCPATKRPPSASPAASPGAPSTSALYRMAQMTAREQQAREKREGSHDRRQRRSLWVHEHLLPRVLGPP